MKRSLFLGAALLWLTVNGQVPTPQWRPVYHFTPAQNWTNDPNGLLYMNGVYHLYNQQNPYGNEWGHMSWGHATSTDLVHWNHLPIAIPETVGWDTTWRFSGCAVYDAQNTSGFCTGGKGCMVAIYTADQPNRHLETQYVAYSNDGGMSFTNYSGNPVIDLNRKDFRDPNVSWNAKLGKWLMAVSMVDLHKVRFYSSPDLKNWTLLSEFGPFGFAGAIWECPAFFPLPVPGKPGIQKWVLMVSSPGPQGGPFIQYFIGDFDGKNFTCAQPAGQIRPVDYGNTFYAAISWNGLPAGKMTYIGWIMPEPKPTFPWRGEMSIPRDLSLRQTSQGLILCQEPAALIQKALPTLSSGGLTQKNVQVKETLSLGKSGQFDGNSYWIQATLKLGTAARAGFRIAQNAGTGEETVIGYDKVLHAVYVDRSHGDTAGLTSSKLFQTIPAALENGAIQLEVLMDKSTLEVFVNHGEGALTTLVFPREGASGITAFSSGGMATIEQLKIWNMDNAKPVAQAPVGAPAAVATATSSTTQNASADIDSTHIPDFSIDLVNGTHFTRAQLSRHKPLMIVYYSPKCDHCQRFGQALSDHIAAFKGAQIVMVTFRPLDEVADFTKECHLYNLPVTIGTEGMSFLVFHHYVVQRFPFIAVYDKNGKLGGIYRDPPADMSVLSNALFGRSSGKVE